MFTYIYIYTDTHVYSFKKDISWLQGWPGYLSWFYMQPHLLNGSWLIGSGLSMGYRMVPHSHKLAYNPTILFSILYANMIMYLLN